MKTAICCIVKNENLYLRDWVLYYKNLGVSNIILYDNNDKEGEYPQQVIGDMIRENFVLYHDVRGKYRYQLEAYTQCYKLYREEYDWIGFFDIDEYLNIKDNSIEELLNKDSFKEDKCCGVAVYWKLFGDSGLLHYDSRPMYQRFTESLPPFESANTFKFILKGKNSLLRELWFEDANWIAYYGEGGIRLIDGSIPQGDNLYKTFNDNGGILNHYNTLTIEEFLYRRFGRKSYADKASSFNKERIMKIFTDINEMTKEKQEIVDEFFNKFEIKEDNV